MKQRVTFNMYCKFSKIVLCVFLLTFFVNQHACAIWSGLFEVAEFDKEIAERYVGKKNFSALKTYLDSYSRDIKALQWMMDAFEGGSGLALYSFLRGVSVNPAIREANVCTGDSRDAVRYDKQVLLFLMIILYQSILCAYINNCAGFPARMFNLFKEKVSYWLNHDYENKVGNSDISLYLGDLMSWFFPYTNIEAWSHKDCPEKRRLLLENCSWIVLCSKSNLTGGLLISEKSQGDTSSIIEKWRFLFENYSSIKHKILLGIKGIIDKEMHPRTLRDFIKQDLPLDAVRKLLLDLPQMPNMDIVVSFKKSSKDQVSDKSIDEEDVPIITNSDFSDVSEPVGFFMQEKHVKKVCLSSTGKVGKNICVESEALCRLTNTKRTINRFETHFGEELNNAQPLHLFFAIRYIQKYWKKAYLEDNEKFNTLARYVMLFIYRVALDCIMTYALTNNELVLKNFKDIFCKKIWNDYFSYSLGMREKLILAPYRKIRGSVVAEIIKLHATVCSGELQERKLFPACIWVGFVHWAASWGRGSWVLKFSNPESITQDYYQIACQKYHREQLRGKVIEYLNKIFSKYKTFTQLFESADPLDTQCLKDSVITWRQEATLS